MSVQQLRIKKALLELSKHHLHAHTHQLAALRNQLDHALQRREMSHFSSVRGGCFSF